MSNLLSVTPLANFNSFTSQRHISTFCVMDQFSKKKYKIERYDKNKAEMVKSMKQWVTDTIKRRGGGRRCYRRPQNKHICLPQNSDFY